MGKDFGGEGTFNVKVYIQRELKGPKSSKFKSKVVGDVVIFPLILLGFYQTFNNTTNIKCITKCHQPAFWGVCGQVAKHASNGTMHVTIGEKFEEEK